MESVLALLACAPIGSCACSHSHAADAINSGPLPPPTPQFRPFRPPQYLHILCISFFFGAMKSLALLLLASCCFLAAARRHRNGNLSLPKKYAVSQDTEVGVSKADPVLLEQDGVKALQGGCGVSYDCIYVQNSCPVTLYVAIIYYSLDGEWVPGGPWAVDSEETAFAFITHNRYLYVHAENSDYGITFGSADYMLEYDGVVIPFSQIDIGPTIGSYTITLSCSSKNLKNSKEVVDASHTS